MELPTHLPLPYADDYNFRNSGAHRRPALQVGTTSIAQRLGFWAPAKIYEERGDEPSSDMSPWEDWVGQVEQFILRLYHRLQTMGEVSSPNLKDGTLELFNGKYNVNQDRDWTPVANGDEKKHFEVKRYKTASFSVVWASVPVEMRIELHTEHFELTTYFDLSSTENGKYLSDRDGDLKALFDAFAGIAAVARQRHADILAGRDPDNDTDRTRYRPYKATIYKEIWECFWNKVTGQCLKELEVGEIFADFRGLSMTYDPAKLVADVGHDRYSGPLTAKIGDIAFDKKFGVEADASEQLPKRLNPVIDIVDTYWPLVSADLAPGVNQGDFDKDIFRREEYAFSTFCHRRYIYGTALGVQHTKTTTCEPLHYFILAANPDRWQHGRLLDRLQHLGICRLAALAHFAEITATNRELRRLENNLDAISSSAETNVPTQLRRTLEVSKRVAEIGTSVPSGLSYRAERSKYYVEQFTNFSGPLRQHRIEGFQPYLEFVKRRLGSTFDFIEMTGVRFRRLQAKAQTLQGRLQAAESLDVQSNIRHIQNIAEMFFLIMVAPYYVGSLLKALDLKCKVACIVQFEPGPYWCAIILCWGLFAVRKFLELRHTVVHKSQPPPLAERKT